MKINRKKTKQNVRVKANLNLILWLSFSMFALAIIVVFSVIQNVMISQRAEDQMKTELKTAGQELTETLNGSHLQNPYDVMRITHAVSRQHDVIAYIFTQTGDIFYPQNLDPSQEEYQKMYEVILSKLENLDPGYAALFEMEGDQYAFLSRIVFSEEVHYLYVTRSVSVFQDFASSMRWLSVIAALFFIAIAFVVSGFVSMVITKPLSEVTERAKALAKGDYDVNFEGEFYCTEVAELSDALHHAGKEISKADQMQKELIANVSHDFKTPLTMIKAYAAMIQEISGNDPEKRKKHTQVIIDEADRLTMLVGDLLDLSKMQAGIEQFERTVFNLSEELYLVVGRFSYLKEMQGYTIEVEIEEDLYTYANKARVEQVLYNLIGNAVNYTGEDKKVVVSLKKQGDIIRFEVVDFGKGIPSEEIDSIWERYYRSSEMHKRPIQGTGLGLSIVKTILQRHGLQYGVQSTLGEGSCFWVEFLQPENETK